MAREGARKKGRRIAGRCIAGVMICRFEGGWVQLK